MGHPRPCDDHVAWGYRVVSVADSDHASAMEDDGEFLGLMGVRRRSDTGGQCAHSERHALGQSVPGGAENCHHPVVRPSADGRREAAIINPFQEIAHYVIDVDSHDSPHSTLYEVLLEHRRTRDSVGQNAVRDLYDSRECKLDCQYMTSHNPRSHRTPFGAAANANRLRGQSSADPLGLARSECNSVEESIDFCSGVRVDLEASRSPVVVSGEDALTH